MIYSMLFMALSPCAPMPTACEPACAAQVRIRREVTRTVAREPRVRIEREPRACSRVKACARVEACAPAACDAAAARGERRHVIAKMALAATPPYRHRQK